jgi:aminopeptidase N
LSNFKTDISYETIANCLEQGDSSYYTEAAAARSLGCMVSGNLKAKQPEAIAGESFFLTQVAVVGALGQMQTTQAIPLLNDLAAQTADARVRRRAEEAVAKVQKNLGAEQAVKEIRQEVDRLKQTNQDLASRLAKLVS